jgi:predicted RNA-binding protein YlqC (UPF0109 family)
MNKLLNFLISGITGSDKFQIDEDADGDRITFVIKAEKELMGLIIGKHGETIKALRNIVKIKAALENKLINIEVSEA